MRQVMVRYSTRADRAEENARLIRTAGVKDRCDVAPVTSVLHEVGSYAGART